LVSDGNGFRRLHVMLKAGQVVEIAMLAHGTPPSGYAGANSAASPSYRVAAAQANLVCV
jgi:hypothetical protein